jgi:hypothetical protein
MSLLNFPSDNFIGNRVISYSLDMTQITKSHKIPDDGQGRTNTGPKPDRNSYSSANYQSSEDIARESKYQENTNISE